ncbi:hypothetical protein T4D_2077 [Trichinella pseudospiralis]|uniref:Uncharacterized protein n=1 Tax=Trichinella pseudospiralis TaxID=6337 RepID=A0A0V1FNQ7_TRIPS|nr:hypothetical protein T4D_2077 [Trichinella pseudospiralis]
MQFLNCSNSPLHAADAWVSHNKKTKTGTVGTVSVNKPIQQLAIFSECCQPIQIAEKTSIFLDHRSKSGLLIQF